MGSTQKTKNYDVILLYRESKPSSKVSFYKASSLTNITWSNQISGTI